MNSQKIFVLLATHYTQWSGPDEEFNVDVLDEEEKVTIVVAVYATREAAEAALNAYMSNHKTVHHDASYGAPADGPIDYLTIEKTDFFAS